MGRPGLSHELLVPWSGIGHDLETLGLGQLDDVAPERPRRSGHADALPGLESEEVECIARRQAVHREGGGFGIGSAGRRAHDGLCRHRDVLRVRAVGTLGADDGHDVVARLEVGRHLGADTLEDTRRLHAGHVGWWHVLQLPRPRTTAQAGVRRVDGGRMHPDAELARPDLGLRELNQREGVGTPEFVDPYCSHIDSQRRVPGPIPGSGGTEASQARGSTWSSAGSAATNLVD